MKRTVILVVTTFLVLVGVGVGPSEAAKKSTFKQAEPCAFSNASYDATTTRMLSVTPEAGYWTSEGLANSLCWIEGEGRFHATVATFTATARWYAGHTLIKKNSRTIHNNGTFEALNLKVKGLRQNSNSTWTKNGKRITVKVTFSKKGYKSKTMTTSSFEGF